MKSIIQDGKECYICRQKFGACNTQNLEEHHIFFGTSNRKLSEKYGLKVYLCARHHRGTDSPHQFRPIDIELKQMAEHKFLNHYNKSIEEFISIFGKNYL